MKMEQAKNDDRDSRRVLRWVVISVVVLLIGALTYNYMARAVSKSSALQGIHPVALISTEREPATGASRR
jgi:hypothetical protein